MLPYPFGFRNLPVFVTPSKKKPRGVLSARKSEVLLLHSTFAF
jgi:hypothetical protein